MKAEKTFETIVRKTLPHATRENFLRDLKEETSATLPEKARQFMSYLPAAYLDEARLAFSRWAFAGAFLLVVFCFSTSNMPWSYVAELVAVLGALTLRDGYLHRRKPRSGVPSAVQYCEDSIGDAALAGLFAFVAGIMMINVSPSAAMPFPNLWHGGVILMGMIFTLKMMLRVKPGADAPFINKDDKPERIYRRVRWLSLLWFITFDGVVACNVTDIPHYWPDKLRGFSPIFFFAMWLAFLFPNMRKSLIWRIAGAVSKRLMPNKVYWGNLATEAMMMVLIALSVADAVLPWMTGRATAVVGVVQAVGAIMSGAISLITWKYVKEANHIAAKALTAR